MESKSASSLIVRFKILFLSLIIAIPFAGAESFEKNDSKAKTDSHGKGQITASSEKKGNFMQQKEKYNPETCAFPKNDDSLKKLLSPEQYEITKKNGTEMPFKNAYWNNHHPGIYVDVISKEPLFSSKDKFDSGTGWPSFSKPLNKSIVVEKKDISHGMSRTEVRSTRADSHLGHLFGDGPGPEGLRYCINSGSLKFIPLEKMKAEGYEQWLNLFDEKDWELAKQNPWKEI